MPSPKENELTRREAIKRSALALTAVGAGSLAPGAMSPAQASAVHAAVQQQTQDSSYEVRGFEPHEWTLLRTLSELIMPADDHSGSALDAGAPEFIDLLTSNNRELQRILTSGMLWLEHEMNEQFGTGFVAATTEKQHEMLDRLAHEIKPTDPGYAGIVESDEYEGFFDYTTEEWSDDAPGIRFFSWLRRLVVDAFYSSEEGVKDVGYVGNKFVSEYRVPDEALAHMKGR